MAVVVGIDEVGYGPKLGPLVVCAYAFRVTDPAIDLWKALKSAVWSPRSHVPSRKPQLIVGDSKLLYSPSKGIGSIEPTALAFLSVLPGVDGLTLRSLARGVSLDGEGSLDGSPWYAGGDLSLPLESDMGDVGELAARLWGAALKVPAVPFGCWAAWAEPAHFNRAVSSASNKSDFLFDRACALVKAALAASPGEEAAFFIGKQGGRRFYLPGLVREFGSVWVLGEEPGTSRYEFAQGGRRVRVSFLVDGEERHFGIALASVIGKYLRECAMKRFNDWWIERKPDLRPTAGYGLDGGRFFRQVEPDLERLNIHRDQVLRRR